MTPFTGIALIVVLILMMSRIDKLQRRIDALERKAGIHGLR